jgi:hypothetical protein
LGGGLRIEKERQAGTVRKDNHQCHFGYSGELLGFVQIVNLSLITEAKYTFRG